MTQKTEMRQTSSKEEDSFEEARQTFVDTEERIVKPDASSAEFLKMRNEIVI
jgi:hypothetical protein